MKKLYYTDPLAAAYMAREFGVKYENCTFDTKITSFREISKGLIKGREIDWFDRYYIHPDSYHIFEPQGIDLIEVITPENYPHHALQVHLMYYRGRGYRAIQDNESVKIIQRNNKPFFWPEEE